MKKILFLFVVSLCLLGVAYGQTRIISGKVTDSKDEPLIGVGVTVKDTALGTTTDVDGNYAIPVPSKFTALVFRYVGMKKKEVALGTDNVVNPKMEEDALGLEEVVVTAIGIKQEKKRLGYSVQEVSGDDVSKTDNANMVGGLGGKVAGVQVTNSSGAPGGSAYIKLRGATSLTGSNQPLIIIDGIPFNNAELGNSLGGVAQSNRGIDINPDDIANITVLKGPAATALYGINASNGALVITTKKGATAGSGRKMSVSYSSSLSFDKITHLPALQHKFVQGSAGKYQDPSTGQSGSWGPNSDTLYWDGNTSYKYDSHGKIVYQSNAAKKDKFVPYDNVGTFFQTGMAFDNAIALMGGGDDGAFRFSASHLSQTGTVPLSDFGRTTLKIAGDQKISSKFRASGSVSYTNSGGRRVQQGSNVSGLMLGLTRTPISFDNSNGKKDPEDSTAYIFPDGTQRNYRGNRGYDNPYFTINENVFRDKVNRMFGFGQVDYEACQWLGVTYRVGTDFYSDRRKQFFAINSRANSAGQVWEDQFYYQHVNSDLLATAHKSLTSDLNGSLTIGNNLYSQYFQELYTQGDGLNFPGFYNISNAQTVLSQESQSRKRTMAFYADAKLDYKNMLYFNLTARQERSSTLPLDHNAFFYPSTSLAFVFTEPLHMSENKILPFGKIRISYSQVGKDAPSYATQNYYTAATAADGWTSGIVFPFNGIGGFSTSTLLGNPNLRPEKTNSFELGTDLRFLNNRIALDVTYYTSKSIDQIFSVPIAGSSGYQNIVLNAGSIQNNGLEIALLTTPVKLKNFQWNLNLNWSSNRNKVLALADGVDNLFIGGFEGTAIRAVVGEPYGQIYGGKWLRDKNGKVVIDDNKTSGTYGKPIADDKIGVIGNTNPKWLGGISNIFTYQRISLSSLINIKHGGDLWNGTKGALTTIGTSELSGTRGSTTVFEGVKKSDGSVNDIVTTLDQAWFQGNGGGFGAVAEQFIEDGSFIRLSEVALTYNVNPKFLSKAHITGLDVSFFGRNLWLHTKYTGVDPETSLAGASNAQGMDYFNMPGTRTMGVKLRVTL